MSSNTSSPALKLNIGLIKFMAWFWMLGFGAATIHVFVVPVGILFGFQMFKITRDFPDLGTRSEAIFMIVSSLVVGIAILKWSWPATVLVLIFGPVVIAVLDAVFQELRSWLNKRKEVSA